MSLTQDKKSLHIIIFVISVCTLYVNELIWLLSWFFCIFCECYVFYGCMINPTFKLQWINNKSKILCAVEVRRHTPWSRVRCHGCWLTHSQFHSQFHSRRHSLRITLKYTTLVRMRSSYAWTMKPWQRSEWRLGFNSVYLTEELSLFPLHQGRESTPDDHMSVVHDGVEESPCRKLGLLTVGMAKHILSSDSFVCMVGLHDISFKIHSCIYHILISEEISTTEKKRKTEI